MRINLKHGISVCMAAGFILLALGSVTTGPAAQSVEAEEKSDATSFFTQHAERQKARDEKGKLLATGYIYHGVDEDEKSISLFDSRALKEGHAYYISGFIVNSLGRGLTSIERSYQRLDYASETVKRELLGAKGGNVVIAGGKPPSRTPVVLGLVK
jgi:hypothetical protein